MSQSVTLEETAALLQKADHILLLTHQYPDGDTIGSGYALCQALQSLGKTARVACSDEIPGKYAYMTEPVPSPTFEPSFICAVDVADAKLLGPRLEPYADRVDLAIDHHASHRDFQRYLLLDADASATALLIYDLLLCLGAEMTPSIADCLYTGLATDTGCFKYSNTTAHTHAAAATLIAAGAEVYPINKAFFDTKSFARLQLEARLTDSIELYGGGIVGLCTMPKLLLDELHISEDDVDSISGFARSIEGVEIGIMIREVEDGGGKISLRTSEHYNASELCKALGGGGHAAAAGATVPGGITGARHAILSLLAQRGIIRER